MVKKGNVRVMITMSEQQAKWLRTNAKKLHMSVSKFVKFLMDKNIAKFANMLTPKELEDLQRIARVKWINLYDEEDD